MLPERESLFAEFLPVQPVTTEPASRNTVADAAAAAEYIRAMQQFAALQRNPVLELLAGEQQFERDHKYPATPLSFAGDHWRAYYHSHVSPISVNGEHGHFHFFGRIRHTGNKSEDWAHVAGLSIDRHGQPLMWFAVNQWVTGDAWLPANELFGRLEFPLLPDSDGLLNCWAMSILCLYREELRQLLESRDLKLGLLRQKSPLETVLQSRSVYELASSSIAMLEKLSAALPDAG